MKRYLFGSLLSFGALNAFGGGVYGILGAPHVPKEWLVDSPFTDYLVPSLILLVVVGGSLWFAAVSVFARARMARMAALAAGLVLLGWIAVQVWIIGYVSWMQPVTTTLALAILALATPATRQDS